MPGTVKFLFQPAEESPPPGEDGGAALMLKQGAMENPHPPVVFGLHIMSAAETGIIGYRAGLFLAAMDILHYRAGRTTYGAAPWTGAAFDGGLHGDEQQAVTT